MLKLLADVPPWFFALVQNTLHIANLPDWRWHVDVAVDIFCFVTIICVISQFRSVKIK